MPIRLPSFTGPTEIPLSAYSALAEAEAIAAAADAPYCRCGRIVRVGHAMLRSRDARGGPRLRYAVVRCVGLSGLLGFFRRRTNDYEWGTLHRDERYGPTG